MKQLLFIFSLIAFASCTKVIDLELKSEDEKLVVESLISDQVEPYKVRLTLLSPFFSTSNPVVSNAQVFISDSNGNLDTLQYVGDGNYLTSSPKQGQLSTTYYLKIIYKGQEFTASSRIPDYKMELDSISYIYVMGNTFVEEGYNVIINAQENGSTTDYARFSFWKNGVLQTDPFKYFVVDDIPVNGNYISAQVPYTYQSGDTARAEIQSLDQGYFKYLTALSTQLQSTGGPFDAPPSNPSTNISNGGLGYFAAVTKSVKEIIIP